MSVSDCGFSRSMQRIDETVPPWSDAAPSFGMAVEALQRARVEIGGPALTEPALEKVD
jgi:hypothetical protein